MLIANSLVGIIATVRIVLKIMCAGLMYEKLKPLRKDHEHMCSCKHEEAIECYALQNGISFERAMGFGYSCSCSCHKHSDEQMVKNFARFLKRMGVLGAQPKPKQEGA